MSTFQKLARRGKDVMREYHNRDGMTDPVDRMIAELGATTISTICKPEKWIEEEKKEYINLIRVVLTNAVLIVRDEVPAEPVAA